MRDRWPTPPNAARVGRTELVARQPTVLGLFSGAIESYDTLRSPANARPLFTKELTEAVTDPTNDLADALEQFDRVEANLAKLTKVWEDIEAHLPSDIVFGLDTPEFDDLRRAFDDLASALPAIDGFVIDARPEGADVIAQVRLDYRDIGELEGLMSFEREVEAPGRALAEYRYKFQAARRSVVRRQVRNVVDAIDELLEQAVFHDDRLAHWTDEPQWHALGSLVEQLERLMGDTIPGEARWSDLRRHLYFAEEHDLADIKDLDWPSVRSEVMGSLYADQEPIPVEVEDLGVLARTKPTGPVSTRLRWDHIADDDFERVIFELVRAASGYENTNWLMKTRAADRGRDIATERVVVDSLSGTKRYRVIIQCKHWMSRSVGRDDIVQCREAVTMWQPPLVDVLIVATSGRYSQDAVARVEQWRNARDSPEVELWADSALESMLARRPDIIETFGLR